MGQNFREFNFARGTPLNGEKCKLLYPSTKFLRRILNQKGYQADPDNVQAIKDMKPPRTRRELQVTIGRFNWLRGFICSNIGESVADFCFSGLIKEMSTLNKKNFKFTWLKSADIAFEQAKARLSSDRVNYFADFSKNLVLIPDVSTVAVAGVLIQIIDNKQRIISCVSKTLTETEQKWSATEREAFAILFACE
jgi:hypothetical protein